MQIIYFWTTLQVTTLNMFCRYIQLFYNNRRAPYQVYNFLSVAAAVVVVEEEQRFNFGRAAMQPKYGQKPPRLQPEIVEIDTLIVYSYSFKLDNSAA